MRLKAKLAKLEQRLGVEDCPHCGKPILPQAWGDVAQECTDEEWFLLVRKIFQRYYVTAQYFLMFGPSCAQGDPPAASARCLGQCCRGRRPPCLPTCPQAGTAETFLAARAAAAR